MLSTPTDIWSRLLELEIPELDLAHDVAVLVARARRAGQALVGRALATGERPSVDPADLIDFPLRRVLAAVVADEPPATERDHLLEVAEIVEQAKAGVVAEGAWEVLAFDPLKSRINRIAAAASVDSGWLADVVAGRPCNSCTFEAEAQECADAARAIVMRHEALAAAIRNAA